MKKTLVIVIIMTMFISPVLATQSKQIEGMCGIGTDIEPKGIWMGEYDQENKTFDGETKRYNGKWFTLKFNLKNDGTFIGYLHVLGKQRITGIYIIIHTYFIAKWTCHMFNGWVVGMFTPRSR